jgi:hypothetical protein
MTASGVLAVSYGQNVNNRYNPTCQQIRKSLDFTAGRLWTRALACWQ